MSPSHNAPSRFRDLPREIRDKIYGILLCDFCPPPETMNCGPDMFNFYHARHSIDTAILRTSKDTYREAYEVLVKTNRFVKVTSVQGIPLVLLLNSHSTPVVSSTKQVVDRFSGHVLAVHLGTNRRITNDESARSLEPTFRDMLEPCTLMILYRDLDRFCQAIMDGDAHKPGFSGYVKITIVMAPILDKKPRTQCAPSFETYFSEEKTQQTLLAPFKTTLRGLKNVAVGGRVDDKLSKAITDSIAQMMWPEPPKVLADLASAKEKGASLFQKKKYDDADLLWSDTVVDMEKIHESTSWPNLLAQGGESFVSQIAELYFLMRLNIAHVKLLGLQSGSPTFFAHEMVKDSLGCATKSLKKDHWMPNYMYRPSVKHLAKLRYRWALLWRLQGRPETAHNALTYINKALELQPGDAAIRREKQNILDWIQLV